MTVNDTLAAIEVMQAFTEGKEIQVTHRGGTSWHTLVNCEMPTWDWDRYVYRVKPPEPPKPREYWVAVLKVGENPTLRAYPNKEQAERAVRGVQDFWDVIRMVEVPS